MNLVEPARITRAACEDHIPNFVGDCHKCIGNYWQLVLKEETVPKFMYKKLQNELATAQRTIENLKDTIKSCEQMAYDF